MASNLKRSYDDFEPFCQWQRGQGRDVLEVHLQGYRKEHLRVQINNYGILTISGERPIDDAKISRFRKEIKVSTDLSTDQIRSKFVNGILYIILNYEKSQVKESEKKGNEKIANDNNNKSINEITQRDGILRIELTKRMAASIGIVVAMGIVVGGLLIAWKCSKVPAPPLIY